MKGFLIISIPRSGSNLLRDTLVSNIECLYTLNCDEIPYVWRCLETQRPPNLQKSLGQIFPRKSKLFVEKTCENVIRKNFLLEHLPDDVGIILLSRDKEATRASIVKMWQKSNKGFRYKLNKFFCLPLNFQVITMLGVIRNKFLMPTGYWGPILPEVVKALRAGMSQERAALLQYSILEKEFSTWITALEDNSLSKERVFHVTYENFTINPVKVIRDLASHFQLPGPNQYKIEHILK